MKNSTKSVYLRTFFLWEKLHRKNIFQLLPAPSLPNFLYRCNGKLTVSDAPYFLFIYFFKCSFSY